jgi:hypothetical protein
MVRALFATLSEFGSLRTFSGRGARRGKPSPRIDRLAPAPQPEESRYARGGVEPPLEEVLADPIVQLVMRSDRLDRTDLRAVSLAMSLRSRVP